MLDRYHTWSDVDNKMQELVDVLVSRFEKLEAQVDFLTKELGKLKDEPKVVNNNYYTTPITYPQPYYVEPKPIWCGTTGKST